MSSLIFLLLLTQLINLEHGSRGRGQIRRTEEIIKLAKPTKLTTVERTSDSQRADITIKLAKPTNLITVECTSEHSPQATIPASSKNQPRETLPSDHNQQAELNSNKTKTQNY